MDTSPPHKARPITKAVWGPQAWYWLHTQAIGYPAHPSKIERVAMHGRFWAFIQTLPCPECRTHATQYAREYPPDFSGSDRFQTWAWRFHNAVNLRLGKPVMLAEDYRETYAEEIARAYSQYL